MLGQENPFSEGVFTNPVNDSVNNLYAGGFGPYSQDVLIPAFVSAYTGKAPGDVNLNVFKTRPKVNWRVTYNGLSKFPALKEIFASFNISHGYSSTLTINNFQTTWILMAIISSTAM